jgi:hypothetical protein
MPKPESGRGYSNKYTAEINKEPYPQAALKISDNVVDLTMQVA